jgi:hypothetical protein
MAELIMFTARRSRLGRILTSLEWPMARVENDPRPRSKFQMSVTVQLIITHNTCKVPGVNLDRPLLGQRRLVGGSLGAQAGQGGSTMDCKCNEKFALETKYCRQSSFLMHEYT